MGSTSKPGVPKYASCIHNCWQHGIHDYLHLFDANYGVAISGDVVFADFGEVSSYTPFVRELIVDQKWSERFDYFAHLKELVPEGLHEEYRRTMGSALTVEHFDALWGSKLDELDRDLSSPPKLRHRLDEIPELGRRVIERACEESGRKTADLTEEAIRVLKSHLLGPPDRLETVLVGALQRTQGDRIQGSDIVP